jgi:lipopolysaccharide assembly outer membrane protein LptD (OstA)
MRESGIKRPLALAISSLFRKRWHAFGVGLVIISGAPGAVQAAPDDSLFFAGPDICPQDVIDIPGFIADAYGTDPGAGDTILESDQIETPDGVEIILRGNAQVVQGPQAIFAQQIIYDKDAYTLNASDDVTVYAPSGDRLDVANLVLEMETFIGEADAASFQLAERVSTKRKRRLMDSGSSRQGGFDQGGMVEVEWLSDFDGQFGDADILDALDDEDEVADAGDGEAEGVDSGKKRRSAERGPIRASMRGEAERIFFEGQDRQRLQKARITSCREGQDSVMLTAGEVSLDHATGIGVGTNMSVRFFGVPIFYFPRASFPINNERKTGFLFPSVGSSDRSGTIVEVPYYINIAPNKDATINTRYLSDRGIQIMGEYRYLGENHDGIFRGEILPGDDLFGEDRHAFSFDHRQRFGENWNARVDLQDVSDVDYVDDFRNNVNVSSSSFLGQRASIDYNGPVFRFGASVIDYVNIDSAIDENNQPYARLPRLTLDARSPREFGGPFEFGFDSELVRFDHPGERIEGTRIDATPYLSLPLENVYAYVTPRLSLRHTSYSLDNVEPDSDDNPSRTVPIFSIDSGIAFERDTSWNGRPHFQTLEPRLYYVYAREEDQSDIPVFDTGGGNLSNISNFFRDNRFFGPDRVGDENRLTLGLSTRLIDADNGRQRMEAQIAQIFFSRRPQCAVVTQCGTRYRGQVRSSRGNPRQPHPPVGDRIIHRVQSRGQRDQGVSV